MLIRPCWKRWIELFQIWERTHRVRKQKINKVILTNGCIVLSPLSRSKCWTIKGIQYSNSGHLSLLATFDEDKGKKGKLNTVKVKYGYRHQYQKWNFKYNRQRKTPTKAMFQKLSLCYKNILHIAYNFLQISTMMEWSVFTWDHRGHISVPKQWNRLRFLLLE